MNKKINEARNVVKRLNSSIQIYGILLESLNKTPINNVNTTKRHLRSLNQHKTHILKLTKQIHNTFR